MSLSWAQARKEGKEKVSGENEKNMHFFRYLRTWKIAGKKSLNKQ